jgi:hypothetical protein
LISVLVKSIYLLDQFVMVPELHLTMFHESSPWLRDKGTILPATRPCPGMRWHLQVGGHLEVAPPFCQ